MVEEVRVIRGEAVARDRKIGTPLGNKGVPEDVVGAEVVNPLGGGGKKLPCAPTVVRAIGH